MVEMTTGNPTRSKQSKTMVHPLFYSSGYDPPDNLNETPRAEPNGGVVGAGGAPPRGLPDWELMHKARPLPLRQ